jgi:hypothetical protein
MANNPVSKAARAAAEKLIQTKYKSAGLYATDKARGENRSVLSAAQHAKYSEKNAKRPASAAEMTSAVTDAIQKRSVQVVSSGNSVKRLNPQGKTMGQIAGEVRSSTLQGAGGVLGGQHAGGHSDVMGAINMGGFTVKTPVIKPTSTKNK